MYNNTYSDAEAGAFAAFFVVFGLLWLVLSVALYVVTAYFLSKVFAKAGIKEAWKAWVPVYNLWVLHELGGQPGWTSLLVLTTWIPFLGLLTGLAWLYFYAMATYKVGLNFGKEGVFVLLAIFLPTVWVIWLAVDKTAVWKPSRTAEKPAAA